jgi:DNA repair exonuclease SbcCD nuclease subunit
MPDQHISRGYARTVVHSSDLHVDTDWTARAHGGDGTQGLRAVLDTAAAVEADLVLLAGDIFDHNLLPDEVLKRTASLIKAAGRPVVALPGNHDAAAEDTAWRRGGLDRLDNLHLLGVTHGNAVVFPSLDIEVRGKAHSDYDDMTPMGRSPARRTRWRIVMAHGHYQPARDRSVKYHPSWLIHDHHLAAADADYVALGHWNRSTRVGPKDINAYYSGSPELAGTVNVVCFGRSIRVRCEPIRWTVDAG